MKTLLEGQQLEDRARELGVDIRGDLIFQSASGRQQRASDYELQRRIIDAERATRERWLWIFALIAMITSVLSAGAALLAVLRK